MYTGLFHVQNLTLDESSMEVTCTFAESSNAFGCKIVLSCSVNSSECDPVEGNQLCEFVIEKSISSEVSETVPSDCFQNQLSCPRINIIAYDMVDEDMIDSKTSQNKAAKCIRYTPHSSPSSSVFPSIPLTSVTPSPSSNGMFHCIECLKYTPVSVLDIFVQ